MVATIAGTPGVSGTNNGPGGAARFNYPYGLTTDGGGNVYVADTYNNTIRMVVMPGAVVSTIAGVPGVSGTGNGTGSAAHFFHPDDITFNQTTGDFDVADSQNCAIRQVTSLRGGHEPRGHPGYIRKPRRS